VDHEATPALSHGTQPADPPGMQPGIDHPAFPEAQREHEESAAGAVREKLISLRTMDRPLRLITGLAIAQLVAAAVLILIHSFPQPAVAVSWQAGITTHMPAIIFALCFAFLVIATSFIITGALYGHWIVRIASLAIFSYVAVFPPADAVTHTIRIVLVAVLWLWAAILTVEQIKATRRGTLSPRVGWANPWVTLAVVIGLQLVLYLALAREVVTGGQLFFTGTVTIQLEQLSFFLVPVLFLAGTDFAEFGEILSTGLVQATRSTGARWRIYALLVLLAGYAIYTSLPTWGHNPLAWFASVFSQLFIGAIVCAILALVAFTASTGRWPHIPLSAWALVAATLIMMGSSWIAILLLVPGQTPTFSAVTAYKVYRHSSQAPTFSMAYPATWQVATHDAGNGIAYIVFNGLQTSTPGAMVVFTYPQSQVGTSTPTQVLKTLLLGKSCQTGCAYTPEPDDGSWHVLRYTKTLWMALSGCEAGTATSGFSLARSKTHGPGLSVPPSSRSCRPGTRTFRRRYPPSSIPMPSRSNLHGIFPYFRVCFPFCLPCVWPCHWCCAAVAKPGRFPWPLFSF